MASTAKSVDASPCVAQGGYSPMTSDQCIKELLKPGPVS